LANAFVQAYIDTTLEMRVDPAKQYDISLTPARKTRARRWRKAQARLSDFKRKKALIANDERLDVEMHA
jgi:succinoglycan biosynthesis transport protein ExoP